VVHCRTRSLASSLLPSNCVHAFLGMKTKIATYQQNLLTISNRETKSQTCWDAGLPHCRNCEELNTATWKCHTYVIYWVYIHAPSHSCAATLWPLSSPQPVQSNSH
jgi:hypothetical protein